MEGPVGQKCWEEEGIGGVKVEKKMTDILNESKACLFIWGRSGSNFFSLITDKCALRQRLASFNWFSYAFLAFGMFVYEAREMDSVRLCGGRWWGYRRMWEGTGKWEQAVRLAVFCIEKDLHPALVYLSGPLGAEWVGWHRQALDLSGCSEDRVSYQWSAKDIDQEQMESTCTPNCHPLHIWNSGSISSPKLFRSLLSLLDDDALRIHLRYLHHTVLLQPV